MTGSLPLFHRIAGRNVVVVGEGDAADARRRLVERAGGIVVSDSQPGARLAFIALENPEAVAQDLREAGLLVNVADRPDLCDFTVPALVERPPVLIAVSTGGASAGLAKALRLRLEALLPSGLGALARGLAEAKAVLRRRFPDARRRRTMLDDALASGGALDPLRDGTEERLAAWLAGERPMAADAPVDQRIEIRLRSADPDDLTLREARLLGCADSLAYEPGVGQSVLARVRADAVRCPIAEGADAPARPGLLMIVRQPR